MKVRTTQKDQGLNLFLRKKGKMTNKQGEQLLNPVWNITQKQDPEQSYKQALVQAQKQGTKQLQNSGLWKTEQVKPRIHQPHEHGNILSLTPLIKFSLI